MKRGGGFAATALLARAARAASKTEATPANTLNTVKMLSSVTNEPFSRRCQTVLREEAAKKHYTSQFWITQPQARRTGNATVLPGEEPTVIYLTVEKVIPLKSLSKAVQRKILDEHPPFFGSGVGILSDRKKWRAVTAERLIRLLNKEEEDRALFIDTRIAEDLDIEYTEKMTIDVRSASSVAVYNAEQLDDPYKGMPAKGIALDAITGKRIGQPAHDVLLGVGILRGYNSPMWVAEKQLRYLNLELRPHAHHEAVAASNMSGVITSLSVLPPQAQRELLNELKQKHSDAFGFDVYYLYSVNGWEAMRSRVLVKNMAAINDPKYPFHFVNLRDLATQKPQYGNFVLTFTRTVRPIGPEVLEEVVNEKVTQQHTESRLCVRKRGNSLYFCAEDATLRRYYNASCMVEPYLTVPSVRPVAILNGKLVGRRDEAILRQFALQHKLSSPLWLSESGARKLGVRIAPQHRKKHVAIGAAAAEVDPGEDTVEGFYNIDDLSNKEEVLSLFPKASKAAHFMLDSKWRPVLGKQRQDFLSSLKRSTPLWVSVNECLMSGFEPLSGKKLLSFPIRKGRAEMSGVKLYNSQHTTDPVRVIGLSCVYTRPQGTSL